MPVSLQILRRLPFGMFHRRFYIFEVAYKFNVKPIEANTMPYKKKSDYNNFMKEYMREYRQLQQELVKEARKQLGMSTKIRTLAKKQKKRHKK